jgi:hypothetical protein
VLSSLVEAQTLLKNFKLHSSVKLVERRLQSFHLACSKL